jgi:hypothetical protein
MDRRPAERRVPPEYPSLHLGVARGADSSGPLRSREAWRPARIVAMGVRSSARRWPRNRGESPIRVRRTRRACFAQPARATFSDALRRPQTQVVGRECLRYPTIDSVGPNLVMCIQITAPCYRGMPNGLLPVLVLLSLPYSSFGPLRGNCAQFRAGRLRRIVGVCSLAWSGSRWINCICAQAQRIRGQEKQ